MSDTLNVLITAASRRVALIRGFKDALQRLELQGNVVVTDINRYSPGLYVADKYFMAPLTTDRGYIDRLMEVCAAENIHVIIPTIDDELELMGRMRDKFTDRGITVVISPPATSRICNDKYETYTFFREKGIPTPQTWLPEQLPAFSKKDFPLFLKPRFGRGSVGTHPIRNQKELDFFLDYVEDPIVQEFLEGPEYTLDTFIDFDGRVISVVPRERLWVRAGVMDRGRTVKDEKLINLGIRVAEELEAVGPINTQIKMHGSKPYVFEVNPRFSGGIPLTLKAGAHFPEMICRAMTGTTLSSAIGDFTEKLVMMSYEESLFREQSMLEK